MNNYEERGVPAIAGVAHKRVRMDAEPGPPPPIHQGNGLPINYMDNGHQIAYQPYASSYNAHYPPADVAFGGYGPGGDLAGYASRSLAYAPPAHQAYPPPQSSAAAFVQQQSQQMIHSGVSGVSPYEQHHPHAQHAAHKPAWPPQPMQPLQAPNDQGLKNDMKLKQEIKVEPVVGMEQQGQSVIAMHSSTEPHQVIDPNSSLVGNPLNEDPPKIKIKTDIFKEADVANQMRRGVITESGELEKTPGGTGPGTVDMEGGKSRISDSGNSTDSANKNKFQGFSEPESSTSEDETKIPNEIYFGTPDISTYRPKMTSMTPASIQKPCVTPGSMGMEVKKRGRPKGSCNKPKLPGTPGTPGIPGMPRPQVGRPRGGGGGGGGGGGHHHMAHQIRPFKKDFSGIQFKRRWSDDGLDSSHIPNEVYFGDVPVTMEVLFNYYDANADKEKLHHKVKIQHTPGNVTLVYSSSDSSSDDSSDSDTSGDTDNGPMALQQPIKRGPGRPRGSKTMNRRSDGHRMSSSSPGDKPPGITEMKKFVKAAGIEYDYNKLIDGATSNKERVSRLLGLLQAKGLEGSPTMESCRALYDGPPPRRRGPKPGTKRTPRPSIAVSPDPTLMEDIPTIIDENSRRITRGQTSGKPRQRIVISSDEEDAHTPLSKLRTMRE